MTNTDLQQELDSFRNMLRLIPSGVDLESDESKLYESRKRKCLCEEQDLPPAKRPRIMPWVSTRFQRKCREYRERRTHLLGLLLHWESKTRDTRRMARKRPSSEVYAEYEGLAKAKYPKLGEVTATAQLVAPHATATVTPHSTAIVAPHSTNTVATAIAATPILEANFKNEVSVPAQKRRLIKRLPDNVDEKEEANEVKVVTFPRRKGWRKKGEKRYTQLL